MISLLFALQVSLMLIGIVFGVKNFYCAKEDQSCRDTTFAKAIVCLGSSLAVWILIKCLVTTGA